MTNAGLWPFLEERSTRPRGTHRRRASSATPVSSGRGAFHSFLASAAQNKMALTPFLHRYAMVALSCADHPSFVPSVAEAELDGAAPKVFYTIDTIRRFRREHPEDHLYFIVGADQFLELPTWKNYEALLDCCDFIIASRPGFKMDALRLVIPPDKLGPAPEQTSATKSCCANRRFICSPRYRATFLRLKYATASKIEKASTALCPRAWRNTFSGRLCTSDHNSLRPEIRWAVEAAQDKQAGNITVLNLAGAGAFAEYFLLCSEAVTPRSWPSPKR